MLPCRSNWKLADSVDAAVQLASGLACVHEHQFLHGDLKPNNVGVSMDGPRVQLKLIDFGRYKDLWQGPQEEKWTYTKPCVPLPTGVVVPYIQSNPQYVNALICPYLIL